MRRGLLLVVLCTVLTAAGASNAAYPGRNGLIAFVSSENPEFFPSLYVVGADGRARHRISPRPGANEKPVAVSPDGRRILFVAGEHDDETWIANSNGTARRRIDVGSNPAWSPDGRAIVSATYLELRITDAESGTSRRLISHSGIPSWSPDGSRIAFVGSDLYAVDADGSNLRDLGRAGGGPATPPSWSPDGRRIVISTDGGEAHSNDGTPRALLVVDVATGDRHAITGGADYSPSWSPDGTRILFVHDEIDQAELWTVSPAGDRPLKVANFVKYDYYQRVDGPKFGPTWSPDGTLVAFARNGRSLAVVRPDGSGLRTVTPGAYVDVSNPLWIDGGTALVFAQSSADVDPEIFTVQPDGRLLRQLTHNHVFDRDPAWSPDGVSIAFTRVVSMNADGDQNSEIFVMRADGSRVRRLTYRNGIDEDPSWSRDGRNIVFLREAGYPLRDQLAVIRADLPRAKPRVLRIHSEVADNPTWSPDGRWIAFTVGASYEDPTTGIVSADGRQFRLLDDCKGEEEACYGDRYPAWRPDGSGLVVARTFPDGPSALWFVSRDAKHSRPLRRGITGRTAWSPDGRRIAVEDDRGLLLISLNGRPDEILRRIPDAGSPDWQPVH